MNGVNGESLGSEPIEPVVTGEKGIEEPTIDSYPATLSSVDANGATLEVWPTVGGVAAGSVLEKDSSGQPTIWESFGGSLWRTDKNGRPVKVRDKWG